MMREINILAYLKNRRDGDILVDLRSDAMAAFGTIPGAIHIPADRVGALYDLPRDKPIYLFCQVGEVSGPLAELLSDAGYDAWNLTGGYRDYLKRRIKDGEENSERKICMKPIETKQAPAAIGPYSQGMISGDFIYTSGQIPLVPETGVLIDGDIARQTEQAIRNLAAVLDAAGSGLEQVVKTTCFLKNMDDFSAFNAVYERYFTGKPARSCVAAAALPKGALVEIEAVAVR